MREVLPEVLQMSIPAGHLSGSYKGRAWNYTTAPYDGASGLRYGDHPHESDLHTTLDFGLCGDQVWRSLKQCGLVVHWDM